ncbi:MAG: DUF1707 SHOCT-like domain-containing protein [Solirubrobacteraceae bacterium]
MTDGPGHATIDDVEAIRKNPKGAAMHRIGYEFGEGLGPNVRAGDADRDATVQRLRENHGQGRIDVAEFQERLDGAYAAKTIGELRQLVSDLPQQAQPAETVRRGSRIRWRPTLLWIPVLLGILVLSAAHPGYHHHPGPGPWMLIPMFFLARLFFRRRRPWGQRRP